ncbi:unnamed protein product, partial [Acanthoscelides obtectus]
MKDDNAPPAKWVWKSHSAVTWHRRRPPSCIVENENGMTSRAINRLVPLPVVHPQDPKARG